MAVITDEQTRYLERLLAAESAKNLRVFDRGEITEGWETRIHAFAVGYVVDGEERSQEFILRLFPGVRGAAQAVKEFAVMKQVARWGVPAPRVDFVVTEETPFGDPFIVMERVRGESMADVLEGAPEREVLRLVGAMVDPLVRLHEMPPNELFPARPGAITNDEPVTFVPPELADMRAAVDRYELRDFELLLRWLEVRREEGAPGYTCVLHNDYHPLNMVVREGDGELIILDWSFADAGDFRLDLAWSALLLGVMAGERYREVLIERYEDISGRNVENFSYFEVLKLAARLITIALWLDESAVIPVSRITKQAIRNEYKVHVLNVYDRVKEITELQVPLFEGL
ncbi:MAG: phosphotransferase family protein [Acidimicrobiia bacterium]